MNKLTAVLVCLLAGSIGIALAYVVGCVVEGAWLAPGTDMLRPLVGHPQFIVRTAGIAAALVILWVVLRRRMGRAH